MDTTADEPRARRWAPLAGLAIVLLVTAPAGAGSLIVGDLTSQPIGHYEFCKRRPAECAVRPRDDGPQRLSQSLRDDMAAVTARVNAAVEPRNDIDIYGKDEVWAYPDEGLGDCEDYVLEKRRILMRKGVSLANLLITVVRKPDGEGHAVLTVRTDRGDFILDNLNDAVKPWNETGYRFLKRQASSHTGRWVSLRTGDDMMVGALK